MEPIGDRTLIKPINDEEKTSSGFILTVKSRTLKGIALTGEYKGKTVYYTGGIEIDGNVLVDNCNLLGYEC